MNPLAFYCVASERFFLGAVAMLNSLRLAGHAEPVFVLDYGMRAEQRRLLEPHATLVERPPDLTPHLAKTVAPTAHPAALMILIDVDMLVTRRLDELLERTGDGVLAVRNDRERFVPAWGEILGLGPATPRPYVSSGFVCLGGETGASVLELLAEHARAVDPSRGCFLADDPAYPFFYLDQDVLNAVLTTRVAPERLVALDGRLAPIPPFAGLRILDLERMRCAYRDGTQPFLLHHFHRKPWLDRVRHGLYSRLMVRALRGPGLEIGVPESWLPLRLRSGVRALLERTRVDAIDVADRYAVTPFRRLADR